jgi:hypothetical protein
LCRSDRIAATGRYIAKQVLKDQILGKAGHHQWALLLCTGAIGCRRNANATGQCQ